MECDHPDCYTKLTKMIEQVRSCASKKLTTKTFIAIFCSTLLAVFGYLLALTGSVGDCASKDALVEYQLEMVRHVEQIKASVDKLTVLVEQNIKQNDQRNSRQDARIEQNRKRLFQQRRDSDAFH